MKIKFFVLLLAFVANSAFALETFVGTLAAQKGQLSLTRCDGTKASYVLLDDKGEPLSLADFGIKNKDATPIGAKISANAKKSSSENALLVDKIIAVKQGESCPLASLQ